MVKYCLFFVSIFSRLFCFCSPIVFLLFRCQILLSFLCFVLIFLLYFAPVPANGTSFASFCQLFFRSCPFCFCSSIVFLLFSCQIMLSFLWFVLIFLLYFVPVTINSTVLSLFCQLLLLSLMLLPLCSFFSCFPVKFCFLFSVLILFFYYTLFLFR